MTITLLPPVTCPLCGFPLDAVGTFDPADPEAPRAGDHTICATCLGILIFLDDLTLRPMSVEERAALTVDERHQLAVMLRAVHRAFHLGRTDEDLN